MTKKYNILTSRITSESNEEEEIPMSSLNNGDLDRFLKTDARQILLASGAFKLAPDGHLFETDNDPDDPEEEDINQ